MIRRRHWAAASVTAIALNAVVFSMLAQELDQGAALSGHYGVEVELGMLGDLGGGAQASGEDSEPQTVVAPPAEEVSEVEPDPAPEPLPEPIPEPDVVQKAEVQVKPEPKPIREPKPKPAQTSTEASEKPIDTEASPANPGTEGGEISGREGASSGGGSASGNAAEVGAAAASARRLWYSEVTAHLARHKHYPMRARRMRHEAVITLSFVVARDGSIKASEIIELSEHRELNRAVEEMLKRAEPLPQFPRDLPGQEVRMTIPVEFKLR